MFETEPWRGIKKIKQDMGQHRRCVLTYWSGTEDKKRKGRKRKRERREEKREERDRKKE